MKEIQSIVKDLFESKKINLFIGYKEDKYYGSMPVFITSGEEVDKLVFNSNFKQNLATYLLKPEVKIFGKIAILANYPAVKTILQLAAENQINEGDYLLLVISENNTPLLLENFEDMAMFVNQNLPKPSMEIINRIKEIEDKSREDRWNFWVNEFSSCIKCFACRSVCPMCYCVQCAVECNQPQLIPVAPTAQGNLEWHITRIMHLAGRCISCGECSRVCPMEIPLSILNAKMNQFILNKFGQKAGFSSEPDYALNIYKVDDKENFIR